MKFLISNHPRGEEGSEGDCNFCTKQIYIKLPEFPGRRYIVPVLSTVQSPPTYFKLKCIY